MIAVVAMCYTTRSIKTCEDTHINIALFHPFLRENTHMQNFVEVVEIAAVAREFPKPGINKRTSILFYSIKVGLTNE